MKKTGISTAAARTLRVLIALKGHTLTGISNSELARALGESPANINRALNTLISEGLAIKMESGRFSHSMQMLQIAQAHVEQVNRLQHHISETNQRIAAGSL
ncbi:MULTISPECIES: helix-turn-helix domain-containing protein [Yersinia pseudotuberculosis complex]|uniref:helix-turn-helix domain-containing protein n=1 Tax=Yersinia pseudotuberculosis complex TaxID=1649845 RepID=UPI0035A615E2